MSKEEGCNCRTQFVAIVYSPLPRGAQDVSGHIGVVTDSYSDGIVLYSSTSNVWILPE